MRTGLSLLLVCCLALLGPGAASSRKPHSAATPLMLVERGLDRARAQGYLSAEEAAGYESIAGSAARLVRRLPAVRARNLAGALEDVAAQWRRYTRPRALTLFSMLETNVRELPSRSLVSGRDVVGPDGIVYRLVWGHGYAFHPLANGARLNSLVLAEDDEGTEQLATALLARGIPWSGGALAWEYPFRFGRGKPPWTSGMAQAVLAQALARAGDLLSDESLLATSERAYRAIPSRLLLRLDGGPWIRLYAWSGLTVLNAQLQAVISLEDYAEITGDDEALALADRLRSAARALLPRFDTGYWSLYALRGRESPLSYHEYVINLLKTLAARTGDQSWRETADRFFRYEHEPPLLRPGPPSPTLYPVPADGYRDAAQLRFWLSKQSRVVLRVGGRAEVTTAGRGWNTIVWNAAGRRAGTYRPYLAAIDLAGNRAEETLPAVVVRNVRRRPLIAVRIEPPATLVWDSPDDWTPWLDLAIRLRQGSEVAVLHLGRRRLHGHVRLKVPEGRWHALLVATASSGRKRAHSLGSLPR